jgi:hypothetical protein
MNILVELEEVNWSEMKRRLQWMPYLNDVVTRVSPSIERVEEYVRVLHHWDAPL